MKKLVLILLALSFVFTQCNTPVESDGPLSADVILAQAKKQAKKEKKNIFIMWHASWCGWCHRMDSLMLNDDVKDLFDNNYVIEHLVVKESKNNKHLENPGADTLLMDYLGDKAGIPFWIILDKKGKLLADSYMREAGIGFDQPGKNVGSPANPNEVDHFIKVLKESSDIDQAGLDQIAELFLMKR